MTLEQLVTDLAMSQRLRDAGFPQDTALVWGMDYQETTTVFTHEYARDTFPDFETFCAAPTAGELEEWLMSQGFFSKRAATIQIAYRAVKVGEPLDLISSTSVSQDVKWVGHYFVTAFNGGGDLLGQGERGTRLAALAALVLEVAG